MSAPTDLRDPDPAGPAAPDDTTWTRRGVGAATVTGADARTLWRRYRVPLLLVVLIVLVAVAIGVTRVRTVRGALDPDATERAGTHALAALLDERGVQVRRTTDPAAVTQGVTDLTVLMVPFPEANGTDTLAALRTLSTGRLVLVAPDRSTLDALGADLRTEDTVAVRYRAPDCADPGATAAGTVEIGGTTYRPDDGAACYGDGGAGPVAFGHTAGGADLTVLGEGTFLTNRKLADPGNAALGINLLGGDGTAVEVRWLMPAPGSGTAGSADQTALSDIVPGWVPLVALQLVIAAVLTALWRARRLGPPVTEPLPVVVRAAEAVEGRARLYRRAQARDRAADALRAGALSRLTSRLRLDPGAGSDSGTGRREPSPDEVVSAVAWRSGQPAPTVHAALFGPPPADDAELVRLADTLDQLVRSTLDREVGDP